MPAILPSLYGALAVQPGGVILNFVSQVLTMSLTMVGLSATAHAASAPAALISTPASTSGPTGRDRRRISGQ